MANSTFDAFLQKLKVEKLYAGDISPDDAWKLLKTEKNSILVDVRTPDEWSFVGYPDLSTLNKKVAFVSWRTSPNMEINKNFIQQVLNTQQINSDDKILFLCRSGGRSRDAAIEMTQNGYKNCYNIEGGFEGEVNNSGQRGTKNGWKANNLPWEQR